MANNRIVFSGLEELRAALTKLPEDLKNEAKSIVRGAADEAAYEVRQKYPRGTGNLRNGVRVTSQASGSFGVGATVRNDAPHAWIFENGTQTRRTRRGWNRGVMPPGRVFVPTMRKHRRAMYEELKVTLRSHGLLVTGDER